MALYGESYDTNPKMIEKGKQMLQYLRNFCDKTKAETNIGFSLYSTPAETLATKFCKSDIKDFGVIKGVNDKGYYENSFHYPSDTDINPFDKIDIEGQMSYIPSGGAIQYVEFGNMVHNAEALEEIIRYAYNKCHYFGVNVSSDRCFNCGYVGEMESLDETNNHYRCPQCGCEDNSKLSVIRRLCGYLGSLSERQSVDNKMKEINHRVKHFKSGCE
jgi:ribonucleoside-triphosphate reductase